jgi:CRP/FNR family transcriptional regulator, cyclic AMP receptor protein
LPAGEQELQSQDQTSAVRLFRALPELAAGLPANERGLAERAWIGPVLSICDEDVTPALASRAPNAFDFLILKGVILKQTTLRTRSALEVLGPGDVLAPPLTAARQIESRAVSGYLAHGRASVAPLDDRFLRATARWPRLAAVLHDRLAQQTHRTSMHLAMLHLPRVEERITALFSDLGERFGRVTPEGIVIDLCFTHEMIGCLVGSRRPTVSLALHSLADEGCLRRTDGHWVLARDMLSP